MTRWSALVPVLVLAAWTAVCARPAAGAEDAVLEERPPWTHTADRELLERVVAEAGVTTVPDRPGVALYFRDAGAAVSGWLAEMLSRYLPGLGRTTRALARAAPFVLAALFAGLVAALLVRLLHRREAAPTETPPPATPLPAAASLRPKSADDWRAEVRRRLDEGDPAAATEALWWWLATTLVADGAEAWWTSRELLARARRPDLGGLVRRLDRMIYGPEPPSADGVRGLFGELREALA